MRLGRRLLLAVLLCTAGCTTLRNVPTATPGASELAPGDRVEIVTRSGERLALTVISVGDGSVEGRTASGELVTIGADNMVELKARRFSAARTAALATLIAIAVLGIALDDAAFFPDPPAL